MPYLLEAVAWFVVEATGALLLGVAVRRGIRRHRRSQ